MAWTLHEGDCREFLPEYKGKVNLIVTSPPYDNIRNFGGKFDWEDGYIEPIADALAPGGVIVWDVADQWIDGSLSLTSHRQALAFQEYGLNVHSVMIYEKAWYGNVAHDRYRHNWDYMYIFSRGRPATANIIRDLPNITAGKVR